MRPVRRWAPLLATVVLLGVVRSAIGFVPCHIPLRRWSQDHSVASFQAMELMASPASVGGSGGDGHEQLLYSWFQGQFDNEEQVLGERAQGLLPGETGGHEQIHCRLEPLKLADGSLEEADHIVGATYYFDNKPEAVFRCRLYGFHRVGEASVPGLPAGALTEMRLYRFTPQFEAQLRAQRYDLQTLPEAAEGLWAVVEHLDGCSILWGWDGGKGVFRGVMRHGSCVVSSQRDTGVSLRIEDELRLGSSRLSVNDRGFDCATGRLVYGNHRGLPYDMRRRK